MSGARRDSILCPSWKIAHILSVHYNCALQYYGDHKELEYEHKVKDMHRSRWKDGDWTDDSDQMILIVDAIVESRGKVLN